MADLLGLWRFLRLCRQVRPSLLHCHDSHAFSLGSIAGWRLRIPVVVTRRVLFTIRPTALNRWKYARAARIIAISSAVAQSCRPLAAHNPVVIIPDGVRWEEDTNARSDIRKKLGIADEIFLIATVGHFTNEKNLPLIFSLCRHLLQTAPQSRVLCIGPMDEAARLEAAGFSNLIAPGEVEKATAFYPAFDAYISTALSEGLGSALLDAVVRDIPAIAVNAGGTADIFPEGYPGLVNPGQPGDFLAAVEALIRQPDSARLQAVAIGERARSIFSVERMIDEHLRIYHAITAQRPETGA